MAAALIDAIDKNNERDPSRRTIFLNYSAVDPVLTNDRCSFWHFRFDAHADMRVAALMDVIQADASLKKVYLIGQDYSFGQSVLRESKRQLGQLRPDIQIVGEELHPMGRVKDFSPYAVKILASGAQAVITGNWGNDLTLLVKAAREAGYQGKFYTFYGNALGAPAAIGDAGIGRVIAVADWLPNARTPASEAFYQAFRRRFPSRRMTTCTCACSCWSRRWRRPSIAPAAPMPRPWRVRWNRRTCRWPGSAVACVPATTSSSNR